MQESVSSQQRAGQCLYPPQSVGLQPRHLKGEVYVPGEPVHQRFFHQHSLFWRALSLQTIAPLQRCIWQKEEPISPARCPHRPRKKRKAGKIRKRGRFLPKRVQVVSVLRWICRHTHRVSTTRGFFSETRTVGSVLPCTGNIAGFAGLHAMVAQSSSGSEPQKTSRHQAMAASLGAQKASMGRPIQRFNREDTNPWDTDAILQNCFRNH